MSRLAFIIGVVGIFLTAALPTSLPEVVMPEWGAMALPVEEILP